MTRLFVDTSFWVAAINPRDPSFQAADELIDQIHTGSWSSVHTSDYVVAETLNFIMTKIKRNDTAEAFLAHVYGADPIPPLVANVLRVHGTRFAAALERYRQEPSRGLSFTHWTSVILMEHERIDTIATFNGGFQGLVPHVVPRT